MRISMTLIALLLVGGAAFGQDDLRQSGASLTLKVPRFHDAKIALAGAAKAAGGMLSDSDAKVTEKGRRYGWLRLRVPREALPATLEKIRAAGIVVAESQSATSWKAAGNSPWRLWRSSRP